VEKIIKSERADQKKFFNHARGKRQKYTAPKNITINEDICLPNREYTGRTKIINSSQEAHTWTNQV